MIFNPAFKGLMTPKRLLEILPIPLKNKLYIFMLRVTGSYLYSPPPSPTTNKRCNTVHGGSLTFRVRQSLFSTHFVKRNMLINSSLIFTASAVSLTPRFHYANMLPTLRFLRSTQILDLNK